VGLKVGGRQAKKTRLGVLGTGKENAAGADLRALGDVVDDIHQMPLPGNSLGAGAEGGVEESVAEVVGENLSAVLGDELLRKGCAGTHHQTLGGKQVGADRVALNPQRLHKVLRALGDFEIDGQISPWVGDLGGDGDAAVAGSLVQGLNIGDALPQQRLAEVAVTEQPFGLDFDQRQKVVTIVESVAAEADAL